MKILGNAAVFVIIYLVFMLPTYILPYVGSNSSLVNTAGIATDQGLNPAFWLHLGALLVLIAATWFRGAYIDKKWLVVLPFVAAFFDMAPALSAIPLVPTVLHLLAIILGVIGTRAAVTVAS